MSLTFEDLTVFDLGLIRSNAINILVTTKCNNRYEAVLTSLLSCIHAKGFNLSKNVVTSAVVEALEPKFDYRQPTCNKTSEDLMKDIFEYFKNSLVLLEKDPNRESTWANPRPVWYTQEITHKKPWMII